MEITEERLKELHVKHRSDYMLTYTGHEIYLNDLCDYCYTDPCSCKPQWVLRIFFNCSFCKNPHPFLGLLSLGIEDLKPKLEDFLK